MQSFTFGTGLGEMEAAIRRKLETVRALKIRLPSIVYTDSCCRDRGMLHRNFPSLRDEGDLEILAVPDDVLVQCFYGQPQINTAVSKILQDLDLNFIGRG